MKKVVLIIMAMSIGFSLYGGGGQESSTEQIVMRVGDIENVANLGAIALDRYKDIIEERSGGTITVKAFHASQLGSANKQLELVKSGTLEAFRGSISWLAQFDTGFSLTDFPFTCGSPEEAKLVANSTSLQRLNDALAQKHGIRYITAGWTRLPRQLLVSRPVETLEDLYQVKLRVPECYSYIEGFKALGAAPTPVSFNETYLAMKQGVVAGAENHVESLYNMKWYEAAKHLVITDHSYDITGFIVNDAWWQDLGAEQQAMVTDTFDEVDTWYRAENAQLQQKYIDLMVAEGVTVHTIDKDQFRAAVYPATMIRAEQDGEWDPGLWAEIEALLQN